MWPGPEFSTDWVTFTDEVLDKKLHFLCSANQQKNIKSEIKGCNKNVQTFGES